MLYKSLFLFLPFFIFFRCMGAENNLEKNKIKQFCNKNADSYECGKLKQSFAATQAPSRSEYVKAKQNLKKGTATGDDIKIISEFNVYTDYEMTRGMTEDEYREFLLFHLAKEANLTDNESAQSVQEILQELKKLDADRIQKQP